MYVYILHDTHQLVFRHILVMFFDFLDYDIIYVAIAEWTAPTAVLKSQIMV